MELKVTKKKIIIILKKFLKDLVNSEKSIIFVVEKEINYKFKNKHKMNNKMKLQSLENELTATLKHAEEIMNEIVETAIEQAIIDVINKMSDEEKAELLLAIIADMIDDAIGQEIAEIERKEQEKYTQRIGRISREQDEDIQALLNFLKAMGI